MNLHVGVFPWRLGRRLVSHLFVPIDCALNGAGLSASELVDECLSCTERRGFLSLVLAICSICVTSTLRL